MKNKSLILIIVLMSMLLILFAGCSKKEAAPAASTAEKTYTMRIAYSYADTTQHGRNINYFKQLVEKETNGRVKIQLFPASQLGTIDKEPGMVQSGAVEAAYTINATVEMVEPLEAGYSIPFLFKINPGEADQFNTATKWDSFSENMMRDKLKSKGIYRLGNLTTQAGQCIAANNKREVIKPEDIKGMKIRQSGGIFGTFYYGLVGATAITLSGAEVPVALTQNVIDGISASAMWVHDSRWITKYMTGNYRVATTIPLIVNLKWWESLPKDLQDIIQTKVFPAAQEYANSEVAKLEKAAMEAIQKEPYNVKVVMLNDEQVAVWANYKNARAEGIKKFVEMTGADGQKLVDEWNKIAGK